jgi:hypothetical protein
VVVSNDLYRKDARREKIETIVMPVSGRPATILVPISRMSAGFATSS